MEHYVGSSPTRTEDNSIGKIVSSNQVVYEDAFEGDGWVGDLLYTWRKGSFQQDVILRQLPRDFSPEAWGMDSASSRIELWTEFFQPPIPAIPNSHFERRTEPPHPRPDGRAGRD